MLFFQLKKHLLRGLAQIGQASQGYFPQGLYGTPFPPPPPSIHLCFWCLDAALAVTKALGHVSAPVHPSICHDK